MEQSRDRFTLEDVDTAARTLGFGVDNVLGVDYDDDIPDDFVENAWRDSVKRSWRDPEYGSEMQKLTNEAFRILAETRGSIRLRKIWEDDENKYMNPDRAFNTLEIPKDVDEYMLITAYNMRVRVFILSEVADANYKLKLEETPLRIETLREAMTIIAEVRDSERLRQFLSTGQDRK
jgi:ubiquitin carboxyl-terminal hydrolase 25/28